jgi:predicted RNA-binding Zn-ribbon protein involved in translation (DUF1610 family)
MYIKARSAAKRLAKGFSRITGSSNMLQGDHRISVAETVRAKWNVIDAIDELRLPPMSFTCEICGFHGPRAEYKLVVGQCAFLGGRLERYECPSCGVIFGPYKMMSLSPEELGAEYRIHYQLFSEGDSTESELRAFRALDPKKDGTYLNYGAGAWSRSTEVLHREGYDLWVYEPNAKVSGRRVIRSEEELRRHRFDGIMSNNLLEHLRHPVESLREMKDLLKSPTSRLSHATACYRYSYEYTRFHFFFFTGRSFNVLCERAGLVQESSVEDGDFICKVLSSPTV